MLNVRSEAKNAKTIHVAYAGFAILGVIALLTRTPHGAVEAAMDHWLTMACACQAFALIVLFVHLRNCPEVSASISLQMCFVFCVAYTARCYSVFFFNGYTPEDSLGTYYIYHMIEFCGLLASGALVYHLNMKCEAYREPEKDNCKIWPLAVVSGVIAILTKSNANESFLPDFAWMFAQWMETAAIVPQIWLASRKGGLDKESSHFVALLIVNRLVLSVFWSYVQYLDWNAERQLNNYFMYGIWSSNLAHILLCGDFMYYYFKNWKLGTFAIPV